jgi:hypothetical protein
MLALLFANYGSGYGLMYAQPWSDNNLFLGTALAVMQEGLGLTRSALDALQHVSFSIFCALRIVKRAALAMVWTAPLLLACLDIPPGC